MSHTIAYDSDAHIVEITIQGQLFLNEVKDIYSEAILIAREEGCSRFLSDYRQATIRLSTLELYELPKILAEVITPLGYSPVTLKRALVVARDLEDYRFFETVTVNSGQNTKIFQNINEAEAWLSEK
jgi:hypothetical protein